MPRIGLLVFALLAPTLAQPSITITSVPPFGSSGPVTGTVSGVNFATHKVAIYIHIGGVGWWTKPSQANPAVGIAPNGTFFANWNYVGADAQAAIVYAVLMHQSATPPLALGGGLPSLPMALASDFEERFVRTIEFAGRTWGVKNSTFPVGPGSNFFSSSPNDVWVDSQGRLHLTVSFSQGQWRSTEVVLTECLGYGTYWFTTETEVEDLDANLTFGAFTWDSFGDDFATPGWANREIDFEDSRWGNPNDPTNSQVVVQPYWNPGNLTRFTVPDLSADPTLSRFFHWESDAITWTVAQGRVTPCDALSAPLLHQSTYTHNPAAGHYVPTSGREHMRFNFWINNGGGPANGQASEIIISDFRHSRVAGTLPAGSAINPPNSLRALNGSSALGGLLALGIDDPVGTTTVGSPTALALTFVPDPTFPTGAILPGFGPLGGNGELLIGLNPAPVLFSSAATWSGPGVPVPYFLFIPPAPALMGTPLYAQGVLFDPGNPILSDAMEICLGY